MVKSKIIALFLLGMLQCVSASAQSRIIKDFEPVCRNLDSLIRERTTVDSKLKLKAIMKRGTYLDFYFSDCLSDLPWNLEDSRRFREELESGFPARYAKYRAGLICSRGEKLEDLVTGELGYGGEPDTKAYRVQDPGRKTMIVHKIGENRYTEGLEGRHIALWNSHGLYYDLGTGRWNWQRPCLFQTVEDLFTTGYVLDYLVPMLENAGAYVLLPRERDVQTNEIIVDNDSDFLSSDEGKGDEDDNTARTRGIHSESGSWKNAGTGFGDMKAEYGESENPFGMGTARMAECLPSGSKASPSETRWTPVIPEKGKYAVYISYRTLPQSSENAVYTVCHSGGRTRYVVNQKMGGGMWVYLGTFEFDKGTDGYVVLENTVPDGGKFRKGDVVTADAVKFGGGFGNISRMRSEDDSSLAECSGMPRFTEGARYWLQWSGTDPGIYSPDEQENDYKDDFMSRGDWAEYLSGGSRVNPGKQGKCIPVDLAFALHTDAGTARADSTVGTLVIYTLKSGYSRTLPAGEDRSTSREFANLVQSQIVNDVRTEFCPQWNRRFIWDRGYRESRTPASPAVLCELLSHQNFTDMRYGHDPQFKFTVCRAIYKGMLKYLTNRYGCPYTVQPLPVKAFSANLEGNGLVTLKWKENTDMTEPTAVAEGFILHTRMDDGSFDTGRAIKAVRGKDGFFSYSVKLRPGHIYSWQITAWNKGGKSFPSEILCAGIPEIIPADRADSCILVVNNFDRVSGPAWFDYEGYAGFDNRLDSGIQYVRDISFTGEMYQNRKCLEWRSNDCPGFGASYNDFSGKVIAGNTFDYPFIHGKAFLEKGFPFCSSSSEAFVSDTLLDRGKWFIDLICGKQVSTVNREGEEPRFRVFPKELIERMEKNASGGTDILVSGAHIATDIWDRVYPVGTDSSYRADCIEFAEKVLGYRYVSNYASRTGRVTAVRNAADMYGHIRIDNFGFCNTPGSRIYCVETPDGIAPSTSAGKTFLRYSDTGISAGVCTDFGSYRTVCIGFPIEIADSQEAVGNLLDAIVEYFR